MRLIYVLMLCSLLTGCGGVTGKVKPFHLDYSMLPEQSTSAINIEVVDVAASPNAGENQAYIAPDWGKFCDQDLEVLKTSIKKTVEQLNVPDATATYSVKVYIPKYMQSYTNQESIVTVAVDWCMKNKNQILYDEIFYVAVHRRSMNGIFWEKAPMEDASKFIFTLGSVKELANKSIVQHITEKCYEQTLPGYKASEVKYVHQTVQSALNTLPVKIYHSMLFGAQSQEGSYRNKLPKIKKKVWASNKEF